MNSFGVLLIVLFASMAMFVGGIIGGLEKANQGKLKTGGKLWIACSGAIFMTILCLLIGTRL